MKPRIALLLLILATAGIDYLTTIWALSLAPGGVPIDAGFFDLKLGFNTGISFGLLAIEGVHGYVALIALTLIVTTIFAGLAWNAKTWPERTGFGMIAGGGLGNLSTTCQM